MSATANNDRVVANLAHLAHHMSRRAVQERREGNEEAARKYRSDASWYLRWARQRADRYDEEVA